MKIISKEYDKKKRVLKVTFENDRKLVGFDSKGYKVYECCKQVQVFYGDNKADCLHRMKQYFSIPDVYHVKRHGDDVVVYI